MSQCIICGRPCRGLVHEGHCYNVYHGSITTERRKRLALNVKQIAERLRAVGEYVAQRRAIDAHYKATRWQMSA